MVRSYGCLTFPGLIVALLAVLVVVVVGQVGGGVLFSPGPLNAQAGPRLMDATSHADLHSQCTACHVYFWQTITMADRCMTCHTDVAAQLKDPSTLHGDQYKKKPGTTCRVCHPDHRGPDAPLTDLSMADITHDAFGFSLAAHPRQADGSPFTCKTCHLAGYTSFDQAVCTNCHQLIKADFMAAHLQAYGKNCLACHDGIETYGRNFDHSQAAFQLAGKHTPLECGACHTGARSIADMKATSQDCYSCHAKQDAHLGQLGTSCGACHTPDGWSSATFDHSKSKFPLTGAHASQACAACHLGGEFVAIDTGCGSCHARDDAHQGELGMLCDKCHSTDAWSPATFNHSLTNFPLTGAHGRVDCTLCHLDGKFIALDTACVSCHSKDDAHEAQLGDQCDKCHTTDAWSPATFDHSLTKFPLTGAHAILECTKCHLGGLFVALDVACVSCHAKDDAHAGQFGMDCGLCHSTTAWLPSTFDHSKTGFPLTGAHVNVECTQCHLNAVFAGLDTACASCHAKDDAHAGQFGTDCGTCHSTQAWLPATFDHSRTGFPLTGAHAGLACSKCHGNGIFIGLSSACSSCHADPAFHAGLFSGMSCNQCHNTSSWSPASFNLSHPNACGEGGCVNHEGATCRDCHTVDLSTATCLKCHTSNNPGDGGGGND